LFKIIIRLIKINKHNYDVSSQKTSIFLITQNEINNHNYKLIYNLGKLITNQINHYFNHLIINSFIKLIYIY
jgi:hypothetical protein